MSRHDRGVSGPVGRRRGLTLVEVVVSVVIVTLVLIAVAVMMSRGAQRAREREARRSAMRHSTMLRGIHQSMLIFANSNNSYLPGLDASGEIVPDGDATLHSGPGSSPAGRFAILLAGQYFTGDLLLSSTDQAAAKTKWTTGRVTPANYSWAMLSIARSPSDAGRLAEWRDNGNSFAVMLSDRYAGGAADGEIRAPWGGRPGEWSGSLLRGDNSAGWRASHRDLHTRYGGKTNLTDNLFADGHNNPAGASEPGTTPGYNTLMVYD